jgi:hypothetical protein
MTRPSRAALICMAIALAVGLAEPYLEVAWKCRAGYETSEACVWGRSLFPLGQIAGLLIVAPVTFGLLAGVRYLWRRRRSIGPPDHA